MSHLILMTLVWSHFCLMGLLNCLISYFKDPRPSHLVYFISAFLWKIETYKNNCSFFFLLPLALFLDAAVAHKNSKNTRKFLAPIKHTASSPSDILSVSDTSCLVCLTSEHELDHHHLARLPLSGASGAHLISCLRGMLSDSVVDGRARS